MRGLTLEALTKTSDRVLVGTALDSSSHWETIGGKRRIVTDTRVRVDSTVSGPSTDSEVVVRTHGGRVGSVGELLYGEAELVLHAPCLLFLRSSARVHHVLGMAQGHYPLRAGTKNSQYLQASPRVARALTPRTLGGPPARRSRARSGASAHSRSARVMRPALITSSAALAVLLVAPRAPAFCRAHTCNRNVEEQYCKIDDRNCVVSGNALFWSSNCLRIGINEAGSIRHGISFEQLKDVTEAAFQTLGQRRTAQAASPSFRCRSRGANPVRRIRVQFGRRQHQPGGFSR